MERQKMTRWAAALAAVAAGVAIAGTMAAQAGSPGAKGRPDPVPQEAAAALPSCPSATICAFSGPNATGNEFTFPTGANHSKWIDFSKVSQPNGAPFHPNSIINNSNSDIWVYDVQGGKVSGPYCALGTTLRAYTFSDWLPVNGGTTPPPPSPSPGYTAQAYQPGWFFINYNVNTCVGPVATPLPT
jgi:hypothetical protein